MLLYYGSTISCASVKLNPSFMKVYDLEESGRTEKGLGAQCVYTTNIIKSGAQGVEQVK